MLRCCSDLVQKEMGAFDFEKIDPDSNVLLPFSSGTTGVPKVRVNARSTLDMMSGKFTHVCLRTCLICGRAHQGVALSARNMVANAMQVHHVEDLGDHSLGLLPFYHIYAMMLLHLSIYQGAAKVVLPRFEPETFLNALSTYKVRS